jgi:hypothetical protein
MKVDKSLRESLPLDHARLTKIMNSTYPCSKIIPKRRAKTLERKGPKIQHMKQILQKEPRGLREKAEKEMMTFYLAMLIVSGFRFPRRKVKAQINKKLDYQCNKLEWLHHVQKAVVKTQTEAKQWVLL